jgi:signal transduction histidine kinase/ActR/RegA family two-component response regulator
LWGTIVAGEIFRGEMTNRRKDGSLYVETNTITPVREPGGRIGHFISVKQDITRQLELEALGRQAQKMEALGTLAGGIAHDFNNLLGAINSYANVALTDAAGNDEVGGSLRQILKASDRAKGLVAQLLTFSRQQKHERQPTRLQPVAREALQRLRATLPATIEISEQIEEAAPAVLADSQQVHQMLMNLCINATEAMKDKTGRLEVRLEPAPMATGSPGARPGPTAGSGALLTVTDNGHGMDAGTIARMFEPYFTTKQPWQGSGLGLAVVRGIVEEHGANLRVDSHPGRGTTIRVFFPAWPGPVAGGAGTDKAPPRGEGEHILLVDDEPALAKSLATRLERLGYRVTTETDSARALELFGRRPEDFALVLTDLAMPRMTGLELAGQLLRLRADLRVVLLTGLAGDLDSETARQLGIKGIVLKPPSLVALGQAIRDALGSSRASTGKKPHEFEHEN